MGRCPQLLWLWQISWYNYMFPPLYSAFWFAHCQVCIKNSNDRISQIWQVTSGSYCMWTEKKTPTPCCWSICWFTWNSINFIMERNTDFREILCRETIFEENNKLIPLLVLRIPKVVNIGKERIILVLCWPPLPAGSFPSPAKRRTSHPALPTQPSRLVPVTAKGFRTICRHLVDVPGRSVWSNLSLDISDPFFKALCERFACSKGE